MDKQENVATLATQHQLSPPETAYNISGGRRCGRTLNRTKCGVDHARLAGCGYGTIRLFKILKDRLRRVIATIRRTTAPSMYCDYLIS